MFAPYISYSSAPSSWVLDNGRRPPSKKYFNLPTYTPENRTFKGKIIWDESPFQGDHSWEYTMIFSEDFSHIESGTCVRKNVDGNIKETDDFGLNKRLRYLL